MRTGGRMFVSNCGTSEVEGDEPLRRVTRTWWLAVGLALILAAGAQAATKVVHLTNSIHGAGWYQYLTEMAERFNALQTDIEVEIIRTSYYSDRYATMLAGGTPPDMTDFTPALAGHFVESGAFLDLVPLMTNDPSFYAGDLLPMSFDVFTLPDGAIWAFPIDIRDLRQHGHPELRRAAVAERDAA